MKALTEKTLPAQADADAGRAARRALASVPDRAQREASAALARAAYCARLKDARERRGIGLGTIAAKTKVNESLYAALERGDLSRWPMGLYRRAFFRAYAETVGVPVESSLDEFLRLFPDEDEPQHPQAHAAPGRLRLGLVASARFRISRSHLMAAFVDLALLLPTASVITWLTGARAAVVLAAMTLMYYVVATALVGSSAGAWWLRRRATRKRFKGLRLAR
ncbi:MAG TPA: helix-turn-helix domain-containing protein [Vicinamibacterales bacterium]|nr:helix-turn-helix domain-containing protein [Vicinamibacterales bacterium]